MNVVSETAAKGFAAVFLLCRQAFRLPCLCQLSIGRPSLVINERLVVLKMFFFLWQKKFL